MGVSDDQRLVSAARSGDRVAFARLVDSYYPMLLSSCARMLEDRDLARDAAQEACLRAMLGLGRLREDSRFGAWLIGIGLNVCRGMLDAGRRQILYGEVDEDSHLAGHYAEGTEPAELVAARELATRVRAAIAQLPSGQRQAVALFYIAGLTQNEAAEELGTGPGAIRTRLHKARKSLRVSLQDTYEEYFDMGESERTMIPMSVAGVRRTAATETGVENHIVFLEDADGRGLPIWIGRAEATAMSLVLEHVALPRPGVYQFAASLLAGAGGRLEEVRVTELTESTFYAQAVLSDGTKIDARPSDALTLALISEAPIYVDSVVLERVEQMGKRAEQMGTIRGDLFREANAAPESAQLIAAEVQAEQAASLAALADPEA